MFDDIDFELCGEDAAKFSSFANAQVSITNDLYAYLKEPDFFLFCPTGRIMALFVYYVTVVLIEYCGSLAEPNVKESPYLKQIGRDLHPKVDILWTGMCITV